MPLVLFTAVVLAQTAQGTEPPRLTLDELGQGEAPTPVACTGKPLRFPSPLLSDAAGHVTHVWPNDILLGSVQPLQPVFLLRVDRDVAPEALLADLMVTDGSWASWRAPRLRVRACFKEREDELLWAELENDREALTHQRLQLPYGTECTATAPVPPEKPEPPVSVREEQAPPRPGAPSPPTQRPTRSQRR